MLARHGRTEPIASPSTAPQPGAVRPRRLILRRPGRLTAALLIAGVLFGPIGGLAPAVGATEVIDEDPPPPPPDNGGGAPAAIQATTNQPEFNGNAGNIQPKVMDFSDVDRRTGAFTFSLPIEVPPGVIGLEPQVAINYSSDGPADSLLGVGFGLSSDDCIERRAHGRQTSDGRWVFGRGVPEFSASDLFYLNGRRLVRCDDQPGGATASCPAGTYRTELNNFEKVEKRPASLPNGFKVNKKDGTVVEYGFVRYAVGRAGAFDDATHYCVSRVVKEGSAIAYAYDTSFGNGFSPISTIDYGGAGAAPHRWRVKFNWVPRPADEVRESWASGGLIKMTQRLGSIEVLTLSGLTRVRKYQVNYEPALSPDSNRSRVLSIQESGLTDADTLPAQTFTYAPASPHGWTGSSWTIGGPADSGLNIDNAFVNTGYLFPGLPETDDKQYALGTYVADLDGDGLPDLVRHDDTVHDKVWINRGPTSAIRWTLDSTWSAKFATVPHFFGGTAPNVFDQGVRLIDLNGDGYTDILQGAGVIPPICTGTPPSPAFYAALYDPATGAYERSEAAGFETFLRNNNITLSLFSRRPCANGSDILFQDPGTMFTDVNADGLIDLVVARVGYSDPRYAGRTDWISRRQVYFNDGTTFVAPPSGTFAFPEDFVSNPYDAWPRYYGVHMADVNGDGLPDIVRQYEQYDDLNGPLVLLVVNVWLHNGTGWTSRPDWATVINSPPFNADRAWNIQEVDTPHGFPWTINYPMGSAMLDLNGDGVDDFTRKYCWVTDCEYGGSYLSRANKQWTVDATWALQSQLVQHSDSAFYSQDFDGAFRFADLDRDGLVDQVGNGLFGHNQGQAGFVKISASRVDRDRITMVTNSSGGKTTITYGAAKRDYNPTLPVPKIVVTQITLHNGRTGGSANGEWTTDRLFAYFGGRYDASRREFAGFRAVSIRSSIDGRYSYKTTWLTNGRADVCHPAEEQYVVESELFCPPGPACFIGHESTDFAPQITSSTIAGFTIDSFATNTYPACSSDTRGPFFAPVSNTTTRHYNPAQPTLQVMTYARFWYDDFGNRWATETLKQPTDTITYRDVWTQFAPPSPGGPWILDRPCASGSITPQGGANLARQASYSYYDGSTNLCGPVSVGRLTEQKQYAWNGKALFTGLDFIGSKTFTYTPAGNLATMTNERQSTTTLFWDSSLPEILPRAVQDATLVTTSFTYDAYGNLLTTTDPNQTKRETRYDNLHRPVHEWMSGTNGADPAPDTTTAYLNYGNPATQRSTVTTKLDASRSMTAETWFDGLGRTYLDVQRGGTFNLATSHAYNTAGVESRTTVPYSGTTFSLSGPLVQRDYDALGRLLRLTLPGGYTINTTFSLFTSGADTYFWSAHKYQNGATVERVRHELYDQYDRLRVVTECDQTGCNTPMGSTDPAIHHTTYTYDGADNLTEIALSTGGAQNRILQWFDGLGRLIASKDPNGSNCADANPGDIASGCPWRYEYDGNNNLVRSTDPRAASGSGTTLTMAYDAIDRLESKQVQGGLLTASYQFDYDFDACGTGGAFRGRLGRATYSSEQSGFILNGGVSTQSVPLDPPISVTTRTHCYDSLGRTSRTEMNLSLGPLGTYGPYRFDYTYLNNDALATTRAPDNDTVTFGFDSLARPNRVSTNAAGTIVSNVTYDGAGRRDTLTFGSGLGLKREYRITATPVADQRLKRIATIGAPILDLLFDYDPVGNVKSVTDQLSGLPATFDYDRLDRLQASYDNGQASRTYGYDPLGNRRSTTTTTTVQSSPDEIPEPTPVEWGPGSSPPPLVIEPIETTLASTAYTSFGSPYGGGAGPHAPVCTGFNQQNPCSGATDLYSYDGNGNLSGTYDAVDGSETQYTYDLENRVRTIAMRTGESATWYYGPDGEKVAVNDNGAVTVFADRTYHVRGGQAVSSYFLGDERVAMRPQGQSPRYLIADQVGSVRAVVDGVTGTVVKRLDYFPFGEARAETGAEVCAFRFDGQYRDATGQYDFSARHYIPERGVFIQPDSTVPDLYDPQALNRYAFPNNNPVTLSDPTGHEGEDWPDEAYIELRYPYEEWRPSWMRTGYSLEYYYMQSWWAEAFGIKSVLDPDRYDFRSTPDDRPAFHPPDIPPVTSPGGFGVYTGAPDLPLEGPGLIDPVEIAAILLTGPVKSVVTGLVKSAVEAGAVQAGRTTVSGTAARVTGQLHHAISRKIGAAIAEHPNLAGRFVPRDPRFVTRAVDAAAHSGYQKWHRLLDEEVVQWIRTNPNATPSEFEAYLKALYTRPDLAERFPHGLP
jgi:RHS repeat-associated protein